MIRHHLESMRRNERHSTFYVSFPALYSATLEAMREAGVEIISASYDEGRILGVVSTDSMFRSRIKARLFRSSEAVLLGLETADRIIGKDGIAAETSEDILRFLEDRFEPLNRLTNRSSPHFSGVTK